MGWPLVYEQLAVNFTDPVEANLVYQRREKAIL